MSAVFGAFSFDKNFSFASDIPQMEAEYKRKCKVDRYSLAKRERSFAECCIQYITKESHGEVLPIADEASGVIFAADCLIDNREELVELLNASPEASDGMLMYSAYKKWGENFASHIRGIFSAAILDERNNRIILVADQTASRCLYYYKCNEIVYFSTLMSPILSVLGPIPFNENVLKDYLTAPGLMPNVLPNETPYTGMYKVLNGTYVVIDEKGVTEHVYWTPAAGRKLGKHLTSEKVGKMFTDIYRDCVKDALRTSGKVGASMSSGFDSSTVGVLAASELDKKGQNLHTYTYVTAESTMKRPTKDNIMDERDDVEKIGNMYPNMVLNFLNNQGHNCIENIDSELDIMEIPFKAYVNFANLCEIYSKAYDDGCRVLLTGQCGNSTVSHGYIDDVLYDLYSRGHFCTFLRYLNSYSKHVKESRKSALIGCIRYFSYARKQYKKREFLYKPDNVFLKEDILKNYSMAERYRAGGNTVMANVPCSAGFYRENLNKAAIYSYIGEWETKMSLAYGIIIRDPTKDVRMLEFCYSLPYHYFAYNGMPRWLIRANMAHMLPESITGNWMRYCFQNADYLTRIWRDYEYVKEYMLARIKDANPEWIDIEKVESFAKSATKEKLFSEEVSFDYAVYICILSQFMNGRNME